MFSINYLKELDSEAIEIFFESEPLLNEILEKKVTSPLLDQANKNATGE